MKNNKSFFKQIMSANNLSAVENMCLTRTNLHCIKHSDEKNTVMLILGIFDGVILVFNKNGEQLKSDELNAANVDKILQEIGAQMDEFLLIIKPKWTFEKIDRELHYENSVALVEELDITRVVIEKDGGGKVLYVVYDNAEYKEDPNYWRFFFDENGKRIEMEEFERLYSKDHEFKFFIVYNKIFERNISAH